MEDDLPREGVLQYVEYLQPHSRMRKQKRDTRNFLGSVVIGAILLLIAILILIVYNPTYEQRLVLTLVLILAYAIILFFMLQPHIVHEISHREIHHYKHPVYQEIIREVEKPSIHIIKEEVPAKPLPPAPVSIKHPQPKKFAFIGSSQTQAYHKRECKFVGLIDKKYKIEEHDEIWFERRGFKRCKVCFKKK